MKKYKSKNSNIHQVWEIFSSSSSSTDSFARSSAGSDKKLILPEGITVEQIMDSWLGKRGHPFINVSRDAKSNKIIVTQVDFSYHLLLILIS